MAYSELNFTFLCLTRLALSNIITQANRGVVQLVEQRSPKPSVACSSRVSPVFFCGCGGMADTLVLGTSPRGCGFDSHHPHLNIQIRTKSRQAKGPYFFLRSVICDVELLS